MTDPATTRRGSSWHLTAGILLFTALNYSELSWRFWNALGGETLAKVGPELVGLVVFLLLAWRYLRTTYPTWRFPLERADYAGLGGLLALTLGVRWQQLATYFFKDDYYLWLNHNGLGYNIYQFEPWLSSHPAWAWETIRYFFGYWIPPYQVSTLLSHFLFVAGVYLLATFLTGKRAVGLASAGLLAVTTVHFDAFRWLTHVINFGWQGLLLCLALIAVIWEYRQSKGKQLPYLANLLMMPAFAAGIARAGIMLPLISVTDFMSALPGLGRRTVKPWLADLIRRQWLFYAFAATFFVVRELWEAGSTRPEVITAPLYKIFLYLFGVFSYPPELLVYLHTLTGQPESYVAMALAAALIAILVAYGLVRWLSHRPTPLILWVGLAWMTISAGYFTLFGPHVPVTEQTLIEAVGSHHLSYLASGGAFLIWGYLFASALGLGYRFVTRITNRWVAATIVAGLVGVVIFQGYTALNREYTKFLDLPADKKITVAQFFFETYQSLIPREVAKLNVYYDAGYRARKDNFRPPAWYMAGFWNNREVNVFFGPDELAAHLAKFPDEAARQREIDHLYYIFSDYYSESVEDLSQTLRRELREPSSTSLQFAQTEATSVDDGPEGTRLAKPPVLRADELAIPAMLDPMLTLDIQLNTGSQRVLDTRVDVLAHSLNQSESPMTDADWQTIATSRAADPSSGAIALANLLTVGPVAERMVCQPTVDSDDALFLVSWTASPEAYLARPEATRQPYLERNYALCAVTGTGGDHHLEVPLTGVGSAIRTLRIIPLTTGPVTATVQHAAVTTPSR